MVQENTISVMFDPNRTAFATVHEPIVTENVTVPKGSSVFITHPNATAGLCLTFPLSNFEVTDRRCLRDFKAFVKQLVNRGREFYMELSDDLMGDIDVNGQQDTNLWFIGYTETTGMIGITWD